MRTEIRIVDGSAKIILTCESDFEKDLIEKVVDKRYGCSVSVQTDYNFHCHNNHRIEVSLKDK